MPFQFPSLLPNHTYFREQCHWSMSCSKALYWKPGNTLPPLKILVFMVNKSFISDNYLFGVNLFFNFKRPLRSLADQSKSRCDIFKVKTIIKKNFLLHSITLTPYEIRCFAQLLNNYFPVFELPAEKRANTEMGLCSLL